MAVDGIGVVQSVPVLMFVMAVVAAGIRKLLRLRQRPTLLEPMPLKHIKVLFAAPPAYDWNTAMWECIRAAALPQQVTFGIMLECSTLKDAQWDVDNLLRTRATVDYCAKRSHRNVCKITRQLVRRFVNHDEQIVAIVDHRARFRTGWDVNLCDHLRKFDDTTILSAPAVTRDDGAHFPTLRRTSMGYARRDDCVKFESEAPSLTPSVVWCPEVTVGAPGAFVDWPPGGCIVDAGDKKRLLVPCFPLLEHDSALEEEYVDGDLATVHETRSLHPAELAGLTRRFDAKEAIRKYGSTRAGKLAIRFGASR